MKGKWIVGMLAGALLSAPAAQAVGNHPMAGCGLAYLLFAKDDNSKGTQILAATTNSFYGTQAFGITSGTLGCTEDGTVSIGKELELFTAVNLNNLSEEMAKGSGEYVSAFASLLGADEKTRPVLLSFFQEKYEVLFPTTETTATEMLARLKTELEKRPELLG